MSGAEHSLSYHRSFGLSSTFFDFFQNLFSEDVGNILFGKGEVSEAVSLMSPDNTSDGWLKKKWKIINGIRYLIKGGNSFNNQEPFNEIVATKLYQRILDQQEYVSYELIQENGMYYSACPTMVNTDEELVSAYYIDRVIKQRGNDSLYIHFLLRISRKSLNEIKIKKLITITPKFLCIVIYCYRVWAGNGCRPDAVLQG